MPMGYEKHLDMKERANQGKTLWNAFLKDQTKQWTRKSRRKLIRNKLGPEKKGGRETQKNEETSTDLDEYGHYDFWGAT